MIDTVQYDLTRISYGRKGTFFYVGAWEEEYQRLYVCALLSGLDTAPSGQEPRNGKLFPVILMRDGQEIPYRAKGTPVCITLEYEGGKGRICLQEGSILRIEVENAEVVLAPKLAPHEMAKTRNDGSWEVVMNPVPKLLFCPVRGTMEVDYGFDVILSTPKDTRFVFRADDAGIVDVAIHLYRSNAWRMETYPAFEDCLAGIRKEFEEYLETVPSLPEEFAAERIVAAYIVWSHIMLIDGTQIIYMNKGIHRCTSNWQQCYHAMAQYQNPKFAWELILSMFRYQDEYGMLPDCVNDTTQSFGGTKPPFHGVALQFLSHYTDFSFAPVGERCELYEGLSKWVYWWLSYRDTDQDGIPQYDAADESGWDDSSFFRDGAPAETPDLSVYLILAMENLAKLAGSLGKFYEEKMWKERAQELLKKALDFFWNGTSFSSRLNGTHEWVKCGTLAAFIPLLLGKDRLPRAMIDQMAKELFTEGAWLTPFGLAGERVDSDHYRETGWLAGPILAPAQFLVCLGLHESGRDDLAKIITERYCRALKKTGFAMIINAKDGRDVSEMRWSTRYPNRMSWTALVFLTLGSLFL